MRSAADLPDDVNELKRRLIAAEAGLLAKTLEAEKLKFELARLRRMAFGQSSERIDRTIEQLELKLEEIEASASDTPEPASMANPEPEAASPEGARRRCAASCLSICRAAMRGTSLPPALRTLRRRAHAQSRRGRD
jgi:hypothetical protein